jgi:hypothetical protein
MSNEVLMRHALYALVALALAVPARAQDFTPPEDDTPPSTIRVGVFGFGARIGVDFRGPNQAVMSGTVDVADIYSDRIRLRPSFEIGVGSGVTSYVANLELMYRFLPDGERAVPYVGFGLGLFGQPGCGPAPDCPGVWPQFALGFEIRLRDSFSWLLEYHGEDTLRRHRFFIGLVTRRSS